MKLNTKGITVIELMLGIVLFSIVALGVTFFIVTGTKTCGEAEFTVNVQEESQLVMNQLLNMTGDANSINVKKDTSGDVRYYVMDTDKITKRAKIERIIYFKKSSEELYYYEVNDATSDADKIQIVKEITGVASSVILGQLLGQYIKDFDVTIDTDLHHAIFEVLFELEGKEMKTTDSIALRNKYVDTNSAYVEIS